MVAVASSDRPPQTCTPRGKNTACQAASAPAHSGTAPGLRVAILSTPRSGTTWLRYLLASLFPLPERAFYDPPQIDWATLPDSCIFQLHRHRTPAFVDNLRQHGFRVFVMARHPIDVLLSILHYSLHNDSTLHWLDGEGGDERTIYGAMPCSEAFLEYATGARAKALLFISREWWNVAGVHQVRYENLVADPHAELNNIINFVNFPPRMSIADALAQTSMSNLRTRTRNEEHFWQGRPGLWKQLLPAQQARRIADAHRENFDLFGYVCDADPVIDRRQADAAWVRFMGEALAHNLHKARKLTEIEDQLARSQNRLAEIEMKHSRIKAELELDQLRLEAVQNMGSSALVLVKRLRDLRIRYPRTANLFKRLLRLSA